MPEPPENGHLPYSYLLDGSIPIVLDLLKSHYPAGGILPCKIYSAI